MKKMNSQEENPDSKPSKLQISKTVSFPIAGIGASAGGLEALEQFFGNVPVNSGIAYVVIQHLDPTHAGIMPELLQRATQMKVVQATDQLPMKPNQVYVIPPNKSMSVFKRLFVFI
jgi:two-component system, chemotaxis family, CheB/CheR fusion protein